MVPMAGRLSIVVTTICKQDIKNQDIKNTLQLG